MREAGSPDYEPAGLVARFFSRELLDPATPGIAERAAKEITASGKSYVCLLDSAELLSEPVVADLRRYFSEIYRLTGADSGNTRTGRVALVVASRLDAGWRGLSPRPRFRSLELPAFTITDVSMAVRDLADRTAKSLYPLDRERAATRLGALSAGLPELLTSYLAWLADTQWHLLDSLADEQLFREIGYPFVRNRLLSTDSLLPQAPAHHLSDRRQLIEDALRLVAPYRIFTQSHLREHLQPGGRLSDGLALSGWSSEDLWNAISRSALLDHSRDDPWLSLEPSIRQLLFRYFYPTDEARARAQLEALEFDRLWSAVLAGAEQVAGATECLWHEATMLRLLDTDEIEVRLSESVHELSKTLRPVGSFTPKVLRREFARRLAEDKDLQNLAHGLSDLHGRLIRIVTEA
ncbi:MAG TPA: hypothetical protein VFI65_27330 [Streptosporangiaceae bacterium]|nr:hypothetical protein [Streptosporangiaceae bacterium]